MPDQDHTSLLQTLSTEREALDQQYQKLYTNLKQSFIQTQRTTPKLTSTLNFVLANLAKHSETTKDCQTELPIALQKQLDELRLLKNNIHAHNTRVKALEQYLETRHKLNELAQSEETNPAVQTAIRTLIDAAETTDFTLMHEQALADAYHVLTLPNACSRYSDHVKSYYKRVDALPGGSQPICAMDTTIKLYFISCLIWGTYAVLALALLAMCPAIAQPLVGFLGPIVTGLFLLTLCLVLLRTMASFCGLSPYLSTPRIGMAKAMEDFCTVVDAGRKVKAFDENLAAFSKNRSDIRIEAAVSSIIEEITTLRKTKSNTDKPYDELTTLLSDLNSLIADGTDIAIDSFISQYNATTCLTRFTRFFIPAEHHKLDQAVNNLVLSLKGHPRILERMAQEAASFDQLVNDM